MIESGNTEQAVVEKKDEENELEAIDFDEELETINVFFRVFVGLNDMHKEKSERSSGFQLFQKIYFYYNWMQTMIFILGEIINYVKELKHFDNETFLMLSEMLPCSILTVIAAIKAYMFWAHRKRFLKIIGTLRDYWPNTKNRYIRRIVDQTVIYAGKFCGFYITQFKYLVSVYNFIPLFIIAYNYFMMFTKDHSKRWNDNLVMPYLIWYPYDPMRNWWVFAINFFFQNMAGYFVCIIHACGDAYFCLILSHICMQLKLCQRDLRRLNNKEEEIEDYEKDPDIEEGLKNVVIKHRRLIQTAKDLEDMYSMVLFLHVGSSTFLICFQLICFIIAAPEQLPKHAFFAITSVFEIFLLCYYGDMLKTEHEGMMKAAFDSGWVDGTKSMRFAVVFIQMRSSEEVYICPMNYTPITISTFSSIIRASWSYFTILRNVLGEDN